MPLEILLSMAILLTGGALAGGLAGRRRRIRRARLRAGAAPLALAKEGDELLEGQAAAMSTKAVTAPLSDRPCLAYELTVRSIGDDPRGLLLRKADGARLFLQDGGRVAELVGPIEWALQTEPGDAGLVMTLREVMSDPRYAGLLEELAETGAPLSRFGIPQGYRFCEAILEDGDQIVVAGRLVSRRTFSGVSDAAYREIPRSWKVVGRAVGPVTVYRSRGIKE